MSNTLSIGAVTATLRQLLSKVAEPLGLDPVVDPDLADATVTARPPDRARLNDSANQLNVFLYNTGINGSLRNAGMPGTAAGDATISPLPLNLHYLITAYGRDHDDILSHRLLGRAMCLLHDRSTLLPADIESALPGADLSRQFERIRITPQPLTTEELSKLWATFQTPYRISAAYEVRVVLIESNRRSKAGPPVIWRGPTNRGNPVGPSTIPPTPTLIDVAFPAAKQPSVRPGELMRFSGSALAGAEVHALFVHRLTQIVLEPPVVTNASAAGFELTLPVQPGTWPAGLYGVAAQVVPFMGETRTTNLLAVTVAPRIANVSPASPANLDADGKVTLAVTIDPPVWSAQRVSLLVGDLEYPARPLPAGPPVATIEFEVVARGPGNHPLRVRVDGVDSFIVRYDTEPLSIDPEPVLHMTLLP